MIKSAPKHPKTAAKVDRFNLYLRDNPTSTMELAAKILGLCAGTVRKWKQHGWIDHHGFYQRQVNAPITQTPIETIKPGRNFAKRHVVTAENMASTIVQDASRIKGRSSKSSDRNGEASPEQAGSRGSGPDMTDLDDLMTRGKAMKISDLRALLKCHIVASMSDSKAVANYATALKSLAGVQDVELEEIFESERMMRIYCPEEDQPTDDVLEVEAVER